MFSRRNFFSGLAASVAPASAIERTTEPPALAEDEPTKESRRAVRQRLAGDIKCFIEYASPEDAWLMGEILTVWDSHSRPSGPEVYLASAFQYAIGRPDGYLKCPERVLDQLVPLIQLLEAEAEKARRPRLGRREQSELIGKFAALVYSADRERVWAIEDALARWEGEPSEGGVS